MKTRSHVLLILLLSTGSLLARRAQGQLAEAPGPIRAGRFHCSPAPCVLPPTQASEGGSIVTDSLIVTNPLNQKELLLGSFDGNCDPSALGFHLSRDRGSTWNRVLCMPFIYIKNLVYVPSFEPAVGYDRNGTAYVAGFYNDNEGGNHGFLAVQKSTNGTHWSKPVVALQLAGSTQPLWTSLTVDTSPSSSWVNSVYVSGVMRTHSGDQNQVLVSHSADGGATWTQAAVDTVQKHPAEDDFTRLVVGQDGTVYVTWMHCPKSGPDRACSENTGYMMFSQSADGGNSWSSPQQIATVKMPLYWQLPNTKGERVYNYPEIGVDNSNGTYSGNLYVVMYNWTGTYLRVQVIRSADGGQTWSKPVPVAPSGDTHDQFFPSLSVSPTGLVGVSWLDRRNDPNNVDYQAFAAISTDGGQTFPNTQLTQAFSNPDTDGDNGWMGDYTGNTWAGSDFIAAWMDSSNGVDMQEVVGGIRLK